MIKLNMYSVLRHDRSLKLKWISKLIHTNGEFWQSHVASCFLVPLELLVVSNLHKGHFKKLLRDGASLPVFWMDVFDIWGEYSFKDKL